MNVWQRVDPFRAPHPREAIPADERREQLRAQAEWLAANGQHEAAAVLRDEAEALV